MRTYWVAYKMYFADQEHEICLKAKNKEEAYGKAVYEQIVSKEGQTPYSAWVTSVECQNGSYREFNTFEGKPY